jgi:hypothetical protein
VRFLEAGNTQRRDHRRTDASHNGCAYAYDDRSTNACHDCGAETSDYGCTPTCDDCGTGEGRHFRRTARHRRAEARNGCAEATDYEGASSGNDRCTEEARNHCRSEDGHERCAQRDYRRSVAISPKRLMSLDPRVK